MKELSNLLNPSFPRSQTFSTLIMKSSEGLKRHYLIMTAWEDGLFEYTITPKTTQEIAQQLGYHEDMTQMFCDALTEVGLLLKEEDKYCNSPLTRNYLIQSSSRYMRHTLENLKKTDKDLEILLPIGGGTFIDASAKKSSKVLVDIGSGLVSEKNYDDAIKKIDERVKNLEKTQEKLAQMIEQVQQEATNISTKAQQIMSEQNKK